MHLYLKAGPEGTGSIGDCPFAQMVRMAAVIKQLELELHPVVEEDKPDWLKKDMEGKMPCLDDQGRRNVRN